MNKLTAWSFSRWSTYDTCPAKFKYQVFDKLPTRESEPLLRGARIHTEAEKFIKGEGRTIPKSLVKFRDEIKAMRDMAKKEPTKIFVEESWAFTARWGPSRWDDWKFCWLRVKIDTAHYADANTLVITDFKTGKYQRDDNLNYNAQLDLYAVSAMAKYDTNPDLVIKPRLMYLDAGIVYESPQTYTPRQLPALKKEWENRVKPMFADRTFKPKPNRFCGWCDYNVKNGGPCKAGA